MSDAQKVFSPKSQCRLKRRYLHRREGRRAAKRKASVSGGPILTVYECPHCGWWHMGHPR